MITFLPSKVFTVSSKALDDKRLVAQVGEARIILDAILRGEQMGQPAFDMWRRYPGHLAIYGKVMADEHHIRFGAPRSEARFFAQHIPQWFWNIPAMQDWSFNDRVTAAIQQGMREAPWWLGDRRLHLSHIRALFEKAPDVYAKWRPIRDIKPEYCCVGCNYWWPTHVQQ